MYFLWRIQQVILTVKWIQIVSIMKLISKRPLRMKLSLSLWMPLAEEVKWKSLVVSDSLQPHGLYSPWNSPGQNTGVCSGSLLQGIFPTQGLNPGLLNADGFFTNWATREALAEEGKGIFWSWHFWTYRIIPADGLLSILKWYHFGWEPYILFLSSNREVGCLKTC